MSRAYTSYTTIRCGNRKMAERIELIFTMETDSPVWDGSPDSQRWGTVLLTFVGKSTMYLPLLVKNVPMAIVVLILRTCLPVHYFIHSFSYFAVCFLPPPFYRCAECRR